MLTEQSLIPLSLGFPNFSMCRYTVVLSLGVGRKSKVVYPLYKSSSCKIFLVLGVAGQVS